ncbi:MAG: acyl-CoA dehydrogenase family protein [Kofleriaceae bacterium]
MITSEELIRRATGLVPMLRANAQKADRERRMPRENLAALEQTEILRATRPLQHGGSEMDTMTKIRVMSELARGDGSTAWVALLYSDGNYLVSLFPDEVQAEIFADPHARITATLIPAGMAKKDGDGFRVTGRWPFNTGCLDAQYVVQPAVIELEAGAPEVCLFLMSYKDMTIVDDWYVSGLRGTGSNTVAGEHVFVPESRMLRLRDAKWGAHRSVANKDKVLYRTGPIPYVLSSACTVMPGLAKAAMELFLEKLPTRGPIAYTGYPQKAEAPVTHQLLGEAALKIRAAEHLMVDIGELVGNHADRGLPYELTELPSAWGMLGYLSKLSLEAIELIRMASGAHGIFDNQAIQIVFRDAAALSTHGVLMPSTGIEHYGRALAGLTPNNPWL